MFLKKIQKYLFNPTDEIQEITKKNPSKYLGFLSSILGFIFLLEIAESFSLGDYFTLGFILLFSIVLSPFIGYVLVNIGSWVISGTGLWIGTRSKFKNIRACFAYSLLPLIGYIVCEMFLLILFRGRLFASFPEGQNLSLGEAFILYTVIVVQVVFFIWAVLLLVQSLVGVKRASFGKVIVNLLLAFLVYMVILLLLSLPFIDRCSNFFDFPTLTDNELYQNWEKSIF